MITITIVWLVMRAEFIDRWQTLGLIQTDSATGPALTYTALLWDDLTRFALAIPTLFGLMIVVSSAFMLVSAHLRQITLWSWLLSGVMAVMFSAVGLAVIQGYHPVIVMLALLLPINCLIAILLPRVNGMQRWVSQAQP